MLSDLHDIIVDRLSTIAALAYIGTALQDEQQARPDAVVWLEEDNEITDDIRELIWGIRLSVNHSTTVGAQGTAIYNIVDAVRAAFSGWVPTACKGIQNKTMKMPKIKLTSHETQGPTVYTATLVFRVFPAGFVKL